MRIAWKKKESKPSAATPAMKLVLIDFSFKFICWRVTHSCGVWWFAQDRYACLCGYNMDFELMWPRGLSSSQIPRSIDQVSWITQISGLILEFAMLHWCSFPAAHERQPAASSPLGRISPLEPITRRAPGLVTMQTSWLSFYCRKPRSNNPWSLCAISWVSRCTAK